MRKLYNAAWEEYKKEKSDLCYLIRRPKKKQDMDEINGAS